ncbi:hypothetical protein [uncultured Microscilla sp.]|uniref:hypothetical protein n=1 Tax=uncultured Microscilla sp. TaxID=432653 RepID=UPI002626FE8B|nr:hypothetical protein [uncultured Microscilla sp.]
MRQAKYLLILGLLLYTGLAWAQQPTYKNGHYTNTVIAKPANNVTKTLLLPATHPTTNIAKTLLKVQLDLGETYTYGDLGFDAKVDVAVFGENSSGVSDNLCTSTCLLEISQKVPERLYHFDFTDKINKANPDYSQFRVVVGLAKIVFPLNTPLTPAQQSTTLAEMQANLRVVASYDIEYNITAAGVAANNLKAAITGKTATFTWSSDQHMPNYQLQVLRLHNYANPDNNSLAWTNWVSTIATEYATTLTVEALRDRIKQETAVLTEVDWNRALTLETQSSDKTVQLTLAEGTGYYVWRVRPIGTQYKGGIANAKNWGQWSHAEVPAKLGTMVLLDLKNGTIKPKDKDGKELNVFHFTDNDETKGRSFIYSRTFTEGNRTSESITYANKLNQVKQTQTYLPSKKTTIVTQQMYDYSGRPVMATLPAPLQNQGLKGYYENLVKTQGTTPVDRKLYRPKHFDKDVNYRNPTKVDQSAGNPYNYYTGKNNIPDAEGYAFTRTLFSPDGKVKEQSGVGKTHMIGGGGKTVKTYYSTATETELIRLFGDEAPAASTVIKTINIDQNGTASISYTSKEGKVIATCLAYQEQANMKALDSTVVDTTTEKLLINAHYKSFNKTVASKRIHLINPSPLTFKYMPTCTDLTGCKFSVTILIHRLDDETTTNWATATTATAGQISWGSINGSMLSSQAANAVCNTTVEFANLTLQPGSYLIEKQLTPIGLMGSQRVPPSVLNNQANISGSIQPLIALLTKWMDDVTCNSKIDTFFTKVKELEQDLNQAKTGTVTYASLDSKYGSDLGLGAGQTFFGEEHGIKLLEPYDIEINNPGCGTMRIPINLSTVFDFKNMTYGLNDQTGDGVHKVNPFIQFVSRKTEFYPDLEGFAYSFFWKVVPEDISDLPTVIAEAIAKGNGQILTEAQFEASHIYLGNDLNPAELALLGGYTHAQVKQRVKYIYYKFLAPFMKGWHEPGTFSLMIKHMLTDTYNANGKDKDGQVVADTLETRKDGCGKDLKLKVHSSDASKTAQYYAEDLLECWQSELAKLKVQVNPDGSVDVNYQAGSGGVSSEVDDRSGGNTGVHDSAFDDALPKIPVVRWFLKWILKSKLSKKMRDQQTGAGTNNNSDNKIEIAYEQHLVESFLNCTGYRFAKILDDQDFTQGSHMPLKSDTLATLPAEQISTGSVDEYYQKMLQDSTQIVERRAKTYNGVDRGYYPDRAWGVMMGSQNKFAYILDPVYAFKYFQYRMDSKKTVEVLTCYKDFNGCNYCGIGEVTCDITSKDWTTTQRDVYLQMIRKFKSGGVTGTYPAMIDGKDFAAPTYIEPSGDVKLWDIANPDTTLNAAAYYTLTNNGFKKPNGERYLTMVELQINKMNNDVVRFCDANRLVFRKMLVDSLKKKCYTIIDCKGDETDDDQISEEDINTLVEVMVEECKRRAMVTSYHRKVVECKFLNDETKTYQVPVIEYGVGGGDATGASDAKMYYRKQTLDQSTNLPKSVDQNSEILQDNNITLRSKNYKGEDMVIKDFTGATISYFEWLRFLEVTTMGPLVDVPTVCNGQNIASTLDDNPEGVKGINTDKANNSMTSPNKPMGEHLSPLTQRIVEMTTEEVVENGTTVTKKMVRVFDLNPTTGVKTLIQEFEQQ